MAKIRHLFHQHLSQQTFTEWNGMNGVEGKCPTLLAGLRGRRVFHRPLYQVTFWVSQSPGGMERTQVLCLPPWGGREEEFLVKLVCWLRATREQSREIFHFLGLSWRGRGYHWHLGISGQHIVGLRPGPAHSQGQPSIGAPAPAGDRLNQVGGIRCHWVVPDFRGCNIFLQLCCSAFKEEEPQGALGLPVPRLHTHRLAMGPQKSPLSSRQIMSSSQGTGTHDL